MNTKKRICVIGAGPSGMSTLYHFANKMGSGSDIELVCYEKQNDWGGLWNYSWRTGTDEYGELCHNGMYTNLFTNGAKEFHEYPDYTFEDHFKKAIPSFPPRTVIRDYFEGRWTQKGKANLKKYIKFNNVVRHVCFDDVKSQFTVEAYDLVDNKTTTEAFSHVLVAIGIFNCPKVPSIDGIESFKGRVMHSHDFRNASDFRDQRVLVIGSSYSAEDISIQCLKFGAKSIICTWKNKAMGFKWPKGIEERPLVQKFVGNCATFKDGSRAEFDTVIFCTGYHYAFPFMEDKLRLTSDVSFYPDNLYKGVLWVNGGDNKLFYVGVQNQYFSFTMFDVQAVWVFMYINGKIKKKSRGEMQKDIQKWVQRLPKLDTCDKAIDFQTEYMAELIKDTGYPEKAVKSGKLMHDWIAHKNDNILTYKDQCHASNWTGTVAPKPKVPMYEAFDDSIGAFI
ncbi:trimethylamine monooxygenase-like [Ruditapes philippinarum]|uniref:trimethylamine monooxygenase-like n=1 Tax=Ruditapes philippinarum TaxID=129788 RepID=UPI00295B1273|nr:trimethylamine monooxygenase-like [Ruditapes philippinarum]XP_060586116.1 trimethylamine monooxygenase-like [Ruditapes philippinarum]